MASSRPAAAAAALCLVACAAEPPALRVEPAALALGDVPIGEAATAALALVNTGDDVLALRGLALAEGDPSAWAADGDLADLFPGARAHVTVTFTPLAPGPADAVLAVHTDEGAPAEVPLTGTGTAAGNPPDTDAPDTGAPGDPNDPDTPAGPCGDADGDGHDVCDPGGDCDDSDPAAHPVVVEAGASGPADGTAAAPFPTVPDALAALDGTCREVVLRGGAHRVAERWDDGRLTVRGAPGEAVTVTPPAGAPAFVVGPAGDLRLVALTLAGARPAPGGRDPADAPPGGALRVEGGAASLVRVTAVDNVSAGDGGALAALGGTLALERATLAGNTAGGDGGALYARDARVSDAGSTFARNRAADGGAVAVEGGELALDGTRLAENRADGDGGAVHAARPVRLRVERVTAEGDGADGRGGAFALVDVADGLVRATVVQGARAGEDGGAVAVGGCSALVLANTTIVETRAGEDGGALWLGGESGCTTWAWSNVIAWTEGRSAVYVRDGAAASVAYTLAWGGAAAALDLPSSADGGENRIADPRFSAFDADGLADDDLAPGADSPARDAGPLDGEGPPSHPLWADRDGTRNDRGHTGGPAAR